MKNISKVLILASISVLEEPVDNVIPGRLYVEFSDASVKMIEAGEMDAVVPGVAIKTYRKVFSDNPKFSRRHHEAGLDKWYVIEFDESIPSTKAAADVREQKRPTVHPATVRASFLKVSAQNYSPEVDLMGISVSVLGISGCA